MTPLEAIIVEGALLGGSSLSELSTFCDMHNMKDFDLRFLVIKTAVTVALKISNNG